MSRTHRSPEPRLEALREELQEMEGFMSHGYQSFQHLLEALKSSGHSQCTTVWTKDTVAYRCRTCQINDSSAICEICFHQGDHKFHDFVMYHSESGGCCDCGDRNSWKEDGFCKIHQVSNLKPGHLPAKLYKLTKMTVCWALEKLSISVHDIWARRLKDRKAAVENEMCVARLYMEWVKKVCSVDVLCNLLSVLVTRKFLDGSQFENNAMGVKAPLEILLKTLGSMPEELTEGATTLFLQMLYNGWFKSQFTEELMKHYPLMVDDAVGKVIKHSQHEGVITECKALDSTLDRVVVQLFNVAPTVMELIKNNNLLEKFTSVFDRVLKMSLNQRGTVSVEHEAIRHKVYLRPQGDLRLIVSHSPVAVYVLNERLDVFEEILKVVTYLQWMNPYSPNVPVDFENDNAWTLAIQLEMNTMAIVFQLIARCYSSAECRETVKQALVEAGNRTLKSLHSYLSEETQKLTVKSSMSLHIPLHRVLGAILSKLVLFSWTDNKEGFLSRLQVDYTEAEVLSLLELPLRIAVWMGQVRANQWQHVSEEFYRLELIYRISFWHDQSWDMDLLLLQFCAVAKEKMEHAIILRMAECFDLQDLVTSASTGDKMFRFSPSYIQDFLCIILQVVRDRRNTGMNEEESLQYNVIQWLCVRDQTYSQLCRALSAIPVDHEKLSGILAKVANFCQPKVQEPGYFCLRPEWWTKFDPLFTLFFRNELEDAQERAGRVGKQQFYWRIGSPHEAPPPYNRLTNLLHTQECHQLLWNVLNHVKFLVKDSKTSRAGEALGVTALQMMEIALTSRLEYQPSSAAPQPSGFHPNDILVNIQSSPYTPPKTDVAGSSTSELRSPSMYDLLQELQSLTNAHRLADYAQYTLHLLHSSFQTYFRAGLRPSKSNKSLEYQETTQETPEGDFENLADIELTDIPDPAGLYDFSELSHSSVNLNSTSVTHQEEDCALRMELAGQPVPGQPHCIAAADNEVLSSSHQGRQKDFEDQHRDLGNDNDHGNDDTVPPKGLPKGRGAEGSSKMSTGNALLLGKDPKQKIMTLESTCKTQKCYVGNLAGTGSPDIAESVSSYFGTLSDSADWLSSMFITNQEEHCDLPIQRVGQFEQPVLDQLHCIAAAHKGQPSSSHQGRYIATQPACIQYPFGQAGDILKPTTIVSGQPCLAPYDKGKQQEEQRQSHDSIVWSPVPQQEIPGFINLPDSAELSEIPSSLNYLEGDSVQPILLHEPKCSEIDRMLVCNLKTDCNGYIVGEKTRWQPQLKIYMYKFLDFGILEIQKQPNLDKIYSQMKEEFPDPPYRLDKAVMYAYIRDRLRDLRSRWKKKWEEGRDRPSECSQAAWKTLIEHWSTEKVMAEAEKMKKARGAVKNPSHVGRGGRK